MPVKGSTELRIREEMYRGGGLFSVTSKILVNDFLSTHLPRVKGIKLTGRGDSTCEAHHWLGDLTCGEVSVNVELD